jgi:hypothetical protein
MEPDTPGLAHHPRGVAPPASVARPVTLPGRWPSGVHHRREDHAVRGRPGPVCPLSGPGGVPQLGPVAAGPRRRVGRDDRAGAEGGAEGGGVGGRCKRAQATFRRGTAGPYPRQSNRKLLLLCPQGEQPPPSTRDVDGPDAGGSRGERPLVPQHSNNRDRALRDLSRTMNEDLLNWLMWPHGPEEPSPSPTCISCV